MRMMPYILNLIISTSLWAQDRTLSEVCGPGTHKMLEDWKKMERNGTDYCMSFKCETDDESVQRNRCLNSSGSMNSVVVSTGLITRKVNQIRAVAEITEIIMAPGIDCFQECKEVRRKFILFGKKTIWGLDRKSCVECIIQRKNLSGPQAFEIPGTGVTVYEKSKCYELCAPRKGNFSSQVHEFSGECLSCVGKKAGYEVQYVLNFKNECFEIDMSYVKGKDIISKRLVPKTLCEQNNAIGTVYKKGKEFSIAMFLTGKIKEKCLELDEKTNGDLYYQHTAWENCEWQSVNDSERSSGKTQDENSSGTSARDQARAE